jgi:hypothetical protein
VRIEIEIAGGIWRDELPRQGGLSTLTRPQQRHYPAALKRRLNVRPQQVTGQKGHVALKF